MNTMLRVVALSVLLLSPCWISPVRAQKPDADASAAGKEIRAYFLGNSLTRNVPLERLAKLFASAEGKLDYGMQLGGGHRLEQHLSMRNHGNKPGQGRYNLVEKYGKWDEAFSQHTFDAVVFQPYKSELSAPLKSLNRWPWVSAGDLQAASAIIDYARAKPMPEGVDWDFLKPNKNHVACGRFYIYATWPGAGEVLEQEGEKTYAAYYAADYKGGVQSCAAFYAKLVKQLNQEHPDLPAPVRLIPAGEVLAELDKKIRAGKLPGIEAFYKRNQKYYIKSRRNNNKPSPFDPETFQASASVLNVYADGVHMNDQPHNGRDSGTIGSYVAALTIYSVLTGTRPVGLTVEPYEMFDAKQDAQLIGALQETVWEVVTENELTGLKKDD